MNGGWLFRFALFRAALPLLIFFPAGGAAPIWVTCNGGGCSPGWYKASVTVAFAWDPAGVTNTQACDTNTVTSDTANWSRTCIVTYSNGSQSQLGVVIKKDATPPTVTGGSPSRGPDSNGWDNHPGGINFNGSEAAPG